MKPPSVGAEGSVRADVGEMVAEEVEAGNSSPSESDCNEEMTKNWENEKSATNSCRGICLVWNRRISGRNYEEASMWKLSTLYTCMKLGQNHSKFNHEKYM